MYFISDINLFYALKLDENPEITSYGIYDILVAVNNDKSKVEFLSFKVRLQHIFIKKQI